MVATQSSAAGVLALLAEPEPAIKQHALSSLIALVPQFWAEISEHIALMCATSMSNLGGFICSRSFQRITGRERFPLGSAS